MNIHNLHNRKKARRFSNLGKKWFIVSLFIFAAITAGLAYKQAQAYTIVEYSTVYLQPGEVKKVFTSIKNQTSATWQGGSGKNALYLYGSSSPLKHSSWLTNDLPANIDQSQVKPGENATATFYVQAPTTPGSYTERFLIGNGSVWQKNTVVQISFHVQANQTNSATPNIAANRLANTTAYNASIIDKGGVEWQVDSGKEFNITVKIKNMGRQVWYKEGEGRVQIYAHDNRFKSSNWGGEYLVANLNETAVHPNQTASFTFTMKAPSVPGLYQESFELRVNQAEAIQGSGFTLPIRVGGSGQTVNNPALITDTAPTTPAVSPSDGSYKAIVLLRPKETFSVSGNTVLTLQFGIKNSGTATWKSHSIVFKQSNPDKGENLSGVRHSSWISATTAQQISSQVEPGHLSLVSYKMEAPAKSGSYVISFVVVADGIEVPGSAMDIPVTVTADGYIETTPTQTTTPTPTYNPVVTDPNLPAEPIIRVGLYATTDDTSVFKAVNGGFLLQQNGSTVCSFNAGEEAKVVYDRAHAVYKVSGPRCQTQSTQYYVAVASDGISPLEVTDFYRPVSWLAGANDNKFRSKLELRYTPKTDKVWLINELPIEWYLKGIAETSNVSPMEFQKTLLVAARTYAMYHVERATKHADEFFIVDAKYDQVYRGYGQEARSPSIVAAVEQTRGIVVSYQGKLAITPYFSRSDGRTRDWSEVWYGEVEWCKGVAVPQDAGKTLWGHGVGMSASGALAMAAHEDKKYDQILKYFYTGINLNPWYR
ncbi:hypothetical protein KKG46_01280 [Patescibacteria group bacterium]|nr:hypothetical protein [Patescibacteria group bacterium]